jgi:hypothetical protein
MRYCSFSDEITLPAGSVFLQWDRLKQDKAGPNKEYETARHRVGYECRLRHLVRAEDTVL